MGRQDQIIGERLRKIKELREQGIDPYPNNSSRKILSSDLKKKYSKLKNEQKTKDTTSIAGRVMTIRKMGKIIFSSIQDSQDKIQIVLQDGDTPDSTKDFFKKYVDQGDFIEASGSPMRTKRGELSILVKKIKLLTKSLSPLPEKWHGLQDKEERYRKRYLDLVMNPTTKKTLEARSKIISTIREFLERKGYVEADTPMLQPIYGGGSARPFITELNALKIPLYMAISNELYLKRLIVGGFDKVYTMNRVFRNEGIDSTHNPEFTILETMLAYHDYTANMDLFEELVEYVAKKVLGTTKIKYKDREIELKRPWKRMSMVESIKKFAKIDVQKISDQDLKKKLKEHKIEIPLFRRGFAIAALFEELVEEKLIQPTIIYDYPYETCGLAKPKASNPEFSERFEPYINGWEIGNNYSELNDPKRLEDYWKDQEKNKDSIEDAEKSDEDFLSALKVGMPPTTGLGLGIDRLVMLLTNSASIRDVVLFPFMKPLDYKESKGGKKSKNDRTNSKK